MHKNYSHRARRPIEELYDVVYDAMPDRRDVSRIIDHPRKLVTINLCAYPWAAEVVEIAHGRTCYDDHGDEDY